ILSSTREEEQTKRRIDLLILDSKETITLDRSTEDDLEIIDAGGVAIDRGRIVDAASSQLLERKYSASRQVLATDEIVLPGFVDPHTHLVFQGSREEEFQNRLGGASYLDILRKGGGIIQTVNRTRQTTQSELFSIAQSRLNSMLEAGTTTLEIKSGYGLRLEHELKILRVISQLKRHHPCKIIATFLGAHAVPAGVIPEEYARIVVEEMIPAVHQEGLARSEEHTSELQSRVDLVCRLLLEKKKRREVQDAVGDQSVEGLSADEDTAH